MEHLYPVRLVTGTGSYSSTSTSSKVHHITNITFVFRTIKQKPSHTLTVTAACKHNSDLILLSTGEASEIAPSTDECSQITVERVSHLGTTASHGTMILSDHITAPCDTKQFSTVTLNWRQRSATRRLHAPESTRILYRGPPR